MYFLTSCFPVCPLPEPSHLHVGAIMAFKFGWGLRGLWLGMLVAVSIHTVSYAFLLLCVLDWQSTATEAAGRLRQSSDAAPPFMTFPPASPGRSPFGGFVPRSPHSARAGSTGAPVPHMQDIIHPQDDYRYLSQWENDDE
jgi:hypothetical protein